MTSTGEASGAGARRDEELARIRERVAGVLSRVSAGAQPGPDDDLAALGMDSMARLELLAQLEQEFGVELTEDLIPEFRTMNRVARIIRGALALTNPPSTSRGVPTSG